MSTKAKTESVLIEHLGGERPFLSARTVETHSRQIFLKLDLRETPAYHRRVVAGLTFLRSN